MQQDRIVWDREVYTQPNGTTVPNPVQRLCLQIEWMSKINSINKLFEKWIKWLTELKNTKL